MHDEANSVLAESCQVRRYDSMVVVVLEVAPEELSRVRAGEPLLVLGCFAEEGQAARINSALSEAIADAGE